MVLPAFQSRCPWRCGQFATDLPASRCINDGMEMASLGQTRLLMREAAASRNPQSIVMKESTWDLPKAENRLRDVT